MCIIVTKEKNVGLPTVEQLRNCFEFAFMDRTGYIYYVGDFEEVNGVKFSNGTYEDFWYSSYYQQCNYIPQSLHEEEEEFDYDEPLMLLENDWIVEYDGEIKVVGDRLMLYNYVNQSLYEVIAGKHILLSNEAYVYDNEYELIV